MLNSETKTPELALDDARLAPAQPTPLSLMQKVIESGLNAESVGVMERLVALDRDMRKDAAEREFAAAFNALQGALGSFQATKAVPDKNGNTRYTYLPYDEIMARVQPLLERNGFSISFSTDFAEGRIIQTCTLQHSAGHHRDYKAFVRAGAGPYGATETQADGAAMTYAKRYSLCNALNIVCERDNDGKDDARNDGPAISQEKACYLRERVRATKSDEAAFLRFAGAASYETIGENHYKSLDALLTKKEKQLA